MTLLLKKRLFSSPAAFAHTVGVYRETLDQARTAAATGRGRPGAMEDALDDVADLRRRAARRGGGRRAGPHRPMQPDADDDESALLERMRDLGAGARGAARRQGPGLIDYLTAVCRPDRQLDRRARRGVHRVPRHPALAGRTCCASRVSAATRSAELHGGMATDAAASSCGWRSRRRPAEHPVRILLATDAASEGIDLQNHCHRLVNYDIPFNPNRLEQRIGRIDRYGQRTPPEIRHFVGTGWSSAVDSYEADLEFLSRVAKKVAQMESDLGKVNSVLSDAVTRRMLGDYSPVDVENAGGDTELVPTETRVGEQVRRLRESLDQTVRELGITPAGVKRVVDTALVLARQQPLRPHVDERFLAEGLFEVPTLTGSWARAAGG